VLSAAGRVVGARDHQDVTSLPEDVVRAWLEPLFGTAEAAWLRDTIPGATDVIEIDGGRLFFPDERATELTAALRRHWDTHP
jgi:hypothetical protein